MLSFEDIQLYLPKYLDKESRKALFSELKQFPDNIDDRMYSDFHISDNEKIVYQGDGLKDLLVTNLPEKTIKHANCMILSNTCDIFLKNDRLNSINVIYAPIIDLDKYSDLLINGNVYNQSSIKSHLDSVRKQKVSHIFYLPKGKMLENESIVFFDKVNNCSSSFLERDKLFDKRIFSLSQYGFYLFIFKLSIHFTRVQENINRG